MAKICRSHKSFLISSLSFQARATANPSVRELVIHLPLCPKRWSCFFFFFTYNFFKCKGKKTSFWSMASVSRVDACPWSSVWRSGKGFLSGSIQICWRPSFRVAMEQKFLINTIVPLSSPRFSCRVFCKKGEWLRKRKGKKKRDHRRPPGRWWWRFQSNEGQQHRGGGGRGMPTPVATAAKT